LESLWQGLPIAAELYSLEKTAQVSEIGPSAVHLEVVANDLPRLEGLLVSILAHGGHGA
jgi:hypothetical protein